MELFYGRQLLGASKQVDGSYNRRLPRICLIPLGYVELFSFQPTPYVVPSAASTLPRNV